MRERCIASFWRTKPEIPVRHRCRSRPPQPLQGCGLQEICFPGRRSPLARSARGLISLPLRGGWGHIDARGCNRRHHEGWRPSGTRIVVGVLPRPYGLGYRTAPPRGLGCDASGEGTCLRDLVGIGSEMRSVLRATPCEGVLEAEEIEDVEPGAPVAVGLWVAGGKEVLEAQEIEDVEGGVVVAVGVAGFA